jgi:sigma-B regulation protein RsbU (phosphoserine phosphatase)
MNLATASILSVSPQEWIGVVLLLVVSNSATWWFMRRRAQRFATTDDHSSANAASSTAPAVASPPASPSPDASADVSDRLDWERALKNATGNEKLLRDVVAAMLVECPAAIDKIPRAISQIDRTELRKAAHTVKGNLRILGRTSGGQLAEQLERFPVDAKLTEATALAEGLQQAWNKIVPQLKAFLESAPPSFPAGERSAPLESPTRSTGPGGPGGASHSAAPTATNEQAHSKYRILMIEDSEVDAMLLQRVLREADRFAADHVTTLSEGMRQLQNSPDADAVILDLNLPDASGLETFQTLHERFPEIPIIITTGQDDEELAVAALRQGAQDYVFKSSLDAAILKRSLLYSIERNRRRLAERWSRQLEDELRFAQRVQRHLLPGVPPNIQGFDIAGKCESMHTTVGDFFDFVQRKDGTWDFVVADVCGHGAGPALVTVGTRRLLRSLTESHDDLGKIVTLANQGVCDDTFESLFVTLFVARLNPQTRELTYIGAAHHGVLINASGEATELRGSGIPLGIDREASYHVDGSCPLSPGSLLLMMTDGIWEARDQQERSFGHERAIRSVADQRRDNADQIVHSLLERVKRHCQPHTPQDDLTAVVVKSTPAE